MQNLKFMIAALVLAPAGLSTDAAHAANVKITAIGSINGEFCRRDRAIPQDNASTCARPKASIKMMPNSNTGEIISKKGAVSYAGGEMRGFLRAKVKSAGGNPKKQVNVLRFGGERKIGDTRIAIVPVTHINGAGT